MRTTLRGPMYGDSSTREVTAFASTFRYVRQAMKVCWIAPRIPPAAMNFQFAMDLVGCAFSHIPLPLATLAALTPQDVEVVIYCQRRRLFELADAFRARGRRVAIGGAIASDLPDECRSRPRSKPIAQVLDERMTAGHGKQFR